MKTKLTKEQVNFLLTKKELKRKVKRNNKLSYDRVQKLLFYDKLTGHFYWISKRGKHKKGTRADFLINSNKRHDSYRTIYIDGISYRAHRIAWLYVKGYFPEHGIDHRNRIKSDNRWINLRHVTQACNAKNTGLKSNNTSGVKGVSRYGNRWHVSISYNGIHINLKTYPDLLTAIIVRWNAEKILHYSDCETTSTAYLWLKDYAKKITQIKKFIASMNIKSMKNFPGA